MKLQFDPEDPLFQKLKIGNHIFPGVWSYLMPPEFLKLDFPDERCSTCMSCPKVPAENWRNDYRCCTYHPRVPNFALGLALTTKEGRVAFDKSFDLGMLVPEGMTHSPKQYVDYLDDLEMDQFGKSKKVLCPMLDEPTGFCNIHAFRNSVCSTFFCNKDHGDKGDSFWSAMQLLGSQLEIGLSQWCLEQLGFDLEAYSERFDNLSKVISKCIGPKGGFSSSALKSLWGEWYGKEKELFTECGKLVSRYRGVLFEVAADFDIKEAKKFDLAQLEYVPDHLSEQIDDEEWDQDGDVIHPRELWQSCLKKYHKLWALPLNPLKLNRKVKLSKCSESGSSKAFKLKMMEGLRSSEVDFELDLTQVEFELVKAFEEARKIDWQILDQFKHHSTVRRFLAEVYSRKILVPARI